MLTREFLEICLAFWEQPHPVTYPGQYYKIDQGQLKTPFGACDQVRPAIHLYGEDLGAFGEALPLADGVWLPLNSVADSDIDRVLSANKTLGCYLSSNDPEPTGERLNELRTRGVAQFCFDQRQIDALSGFPPGGLS